MADRVTATKSKITAIANAIRGKLSSQDTYTLDDMPNAIDSIGGGGSAVDIEDDVVFFDYDGEALKSYSKAEFMALSQMPDNPKATSHQGLEYKGWNWTLQEAQTFVNECDMLDIGAMYESTEKNTTMDIELKDGRLSPYLAITVNGTVTVDWGDGNQEDITGTSASTTIRVLHEYEQEGEYIITISSEGDVYALGGASNEMRPLMKQNTGNYGNYDYVYMDAIKRVNFGEYASLSTTRQFMNCRNLEEIRMCSHADSVKTIPDNFCDGCYGLERMVISTDITKIGGNAFNNCNSLNYITIPSNITELGASSFTQTKRLKRMSISPNMTYKAGVFYGDSGIERFFANQAFSGSGNVARECTQLKSAVFSSNVTQISSHCFHSDYSLKKIKLPHNNCSVAEYGFASCRALEEIDDNTLHGIQGGLNAFDGCENLRSIRLSTIDSISQAFLTGCKSLSSITIPNGALEISSSAFANCYGLGEVIFERPSPPTLANSNVFSNLPTDCVIKVPRGSLTDYTSATNYPSSSTYTYEEY